MTEQKQESVSLETGDDGFTVGGRTDGQHKSHVFSLGRHTQSATVLSRDENSQHTEMTPTRLDCHSCVTV